MRVIAVSKHLRKQYVQSVGYNSLGAFNVETAVFLGGHDEIAYDKIPLRGNRVQKKKKKESLATARRMK